MKKLILITAALLLATTQLGRAQTAQEIIQKLQADANAAYGAGDYQTFVENMDEILSISPEANIAHYNIACGYALLGNKDKAIEHLTILVERKTDFGVKRDPDFKSLHGDPRFEKIVAELDRLFSPVNHSSKLTALKQPDFVPEGMAFDPTKQRFLLGSMRHGTIVSVDRGGTVSEFASLPGDRGLSVIGIEVDSRRKVVWACGTAFGFAVGATAEQQGTTGLFGFDLNTGELLHQHMLPDKHPVGGFNDLTVAVNGDIYLTGGPLYRFRDGTFEPFLHETITTSNGITFDDDGSTLFVGGQEGIHAVDMSTGSATLLPVPDGVAASGMDGMYYYNGALIGLQHGQGPTRAVKFTLNDDETAITALTIMERNNPEFLTATTGALVGDDFYYVARGHIPEELPESVDESIRIFAGETQIWHVRLKSL